MKAAGAARLLTGWLRWFLEHLYTDLAWGYDAVAWLSSLGGWSSWRLTALPPLPFAGRSLELGFGTGQLHVQALRQGRRLAGVDSSPQMARRTLRRMRRSGLPVTIVRARAQALPFPAAVFGSAFSTFPSEYIFDPATLAEVRRVLSPGGSLVVVFSARILPRWPGQHLARWLYESTGQAPAADPAWLEPFRRAGFSAHFEIASVPGAAVLQIHATAPHEVRAAPRPQPSA